jgi:hypothetical protein
MAERGFGWGAALFAWVCASAGAVACTASAGASPSQGDSDAAPGDDTPSCQTGGLPTDPWAPAVMKVGEPASGDPAGDAGVFTFAIESNEIAGVASVPASPKTNVFTLKLTDSSGQPVKDATVMLPSSNQALGWAVSKNPWMPLHQHGASIVPSVTNNGDGTYAVTVYFMMPGLWQIYIVAQTDALTDKAEYAFCVL